MSCLEGLLSRPNKLKLLQFDKCYWDFYWGRVLWSDETKLEVFGNKHQRWVGCGHKDSHAEKYPSPL